MNTDLSRALAVAESLVIGADGKARLPETKRQEIRRVAVRQWRNTAPITAAELDRVRQLRREQYSYREIAQRLAVTQARINKACRLLANGL